MATRRIRQFLDSSGVQYFIVTHPRALTAQEAAESTHICGQFLARTVIVRVDGRLVMAVVPATKTVDLAKLGHVKCADYVWLADEADVKERFVGCQPGAVPPFGNLFDIESIYDPCLSQSKYISFPAGTHTDVIVMKFADYKRLARPTPIRMATQPVGASTIGSSL